MKQIFCLAILFQFFGATHDQNINTDKTPEYTLNYKQTIRLL
jgi:hypothetical protein